MLCLVLASLRISVSQRQACFFKAGGLCPIEFHIVNIHGMCSANDVFLQA